MLLRKDSVEDAEKRLVNDRIAFNLANLHGISFIVNSGDITLTDLTDKVMELYQGVLKKL